MKVLHGFVVVVMLGYPLLVYAGLRLLHPRTLAVTLGAVLLIREIAQMRRGRPSPLLLPVLLIGGVLVGAALLNEGRLFLFVPVLINAALLISFGRTLVVGPSMVESLARRRFGTVPPEHVDYCRRVTQIWCAFFLANSALILSLALWAPLEYWALYTGVIAYVLVGTVFAAEMTYRSWRFRRYAGDVTDVFFRRLFPP